MSGGLKFKDALKTALKKLAESGRDIIIRMAFGQPIALPAYAKHLDTMRFLKEITTDIFNIQQARIKVYVAQVNTSADLKCASWNHAKIVAVDGRVAIVGGHNWYETAYLLHFP